jgi:predicted TIM-barrel fold metal-dependent hydrolase
LGRIQGSRGPYRPGCLIHTTRTTEPEKLVSVAGHRVIAIEEHYIDPAVRALFSGIDARVGPPIMRKLEDLTEQRLADMDRAGIDLQVLSHAAPAVQRLDAETATQLARAANDRLHDVVQHAPDRFAAFAMLPTPDPDAAARELERCVDALGFKGAMIHGPTNGVFFDDRRFWPIFERAQALEVPLYLHPANPLPSVIEAYYQDYAADFPALLNAGCGFTIETAVAGIRLILSGVLDKYPDVHILLGHLGEGLPFLLWRIDRALSRPGNAPVNFRDTFCSRFHITTSGFFSDPALLCCMQELGTDRILFSVDYPFEDSALGTEWLQHMALSTRDKAKILHGNAERLLKL